MRISPEQGLQFSQMLVQDEEPLADITQVKTFSQGRGNGGVLRGLQHPHLLVESCNCNAKKFTKQINKKVLF